MAKHKFQKGNKFGSLSAGKPRKTVQEIRDAFQMLVESNLDNMFKWISQVGEKDPAKATALLADLSERVLPKISRSEITGKDGSNLYEKNTGDELMAKLAELRTKLSIIPPELQPNQDNNEEKKVA